MMNLLMGDPCNPISGGWPLRTALCKVNKVNPYQI